MRPLSSCPCLTTSASTNVHPDIILERSTPTRKAFLSSRVSSRIELPRVKASSNGTFGRITQSERPTGHNGHVVVRNGTPPLVWARICTARCSGRFPVGLDGSKVSTGIHRRVSQASVATSPSMPFGYGDGVFAEACYWQGSDCNEA